MARYVSASASGNAFSSIIGIRSASAFGTASGSVNCDMSASAPSPFDNVIAEFYDVFPADLSDGLPPLRDN